MTRFHPISSSAAAAARPAPTSSPAASYALSTRRRRGSWVKVIVCRTFGPSTRVKHQVSA